jgi:hypothetical protein
MSSPLLDATVGKLGDRIYNPLSAKQFGGVNVGEHRGQCVVQFWTSVEGNEDTSLNQLIWCHGMNDLRVGRSC